jgi:hypothetical protein
MQLLDSLMSPSQRHSSTWFVPYGRRSTPLNTEHANISAMTLIAPYLQLPAVCQMPRPEPGFAWISLGTRYLHVSSHSFGTTHNPPMVAVSDPRDPSASAGSRAECDAIASPSPRTRTLLSLMFLFSTACLEIKLGQFPQPRRLFAFQQSIEPFFHTARVLSCHSLFA